MGYKFCPPDEWPTERLSKLYFGCKQAASCYALQRLKQKRCARYKAKLHLTFLKFSALHCSDIFDSKKTILNFPLKTSRHIQCSFHESEVLCVEPTTNWKLDKSSYIKKVGFLHWINKYHWNGLLATNLDFTINVFILN